MEELRNSPKKNPLNSNVRQSPDRASNEAVDATPRPGPDGTEVDSPTVPYGTPLQQRFDEAFPSDESRVAIDEPLAIDLEEMDEELYQDDEEVGAGLFMTPDHTGHRDMSQGLELDEVRVNVDEPLAIDLDEIDEDFWPEEEEEAGAGTSIFMNMARERTTLHEM
jgi:hypothetical protein